MSLYKQIESYYINFASRKKENFMNKIIKYTLVGLGLFFLHQKCTFANSKFELEQDPNTLTYKIERTDKTVQLYFFIVKDKDTKEFVYCLEPGVALSNDIYEELEEWEYQKLHLSQEQKEYISKVAYYGYHYPGHNHIYYYYAAQLLIWEKIIPSDWKIYYTDFLGGNQVEWFQNERREILNLMKEDEILPSLAGKHFTWNKIEALNLTDEFGKLEEYYVKNSNSVTVKQDKNKLEITSQTNQKNTITFQKDYPGNPIKFYYREDGQNTMKKGKLTSKQFEITIMPYFLELEVQKQNEKELPISNVTFGLYSKQDIYNAKGDMIYSKDTCIEKKTTTMDGKVLFSNLYEGEYYIKELEVPKEYEPKKEPIDVTIQKEKEKQTIKVTNKTKTQNLKIRKEDETTKELLAGVHFQIWKEDTCIWDGFTNEFGIIEIENLPVGDYKIVEIETIFGYEITKNPTFFQLDGEEKTYSIILTNRKIEKVPNTNEFELTKHMIYEKKRKYES